MSYIVLIEVRVFVTGCTFATEARAVTGGMKICVDKPLLVHALDSLIAHIYLASQDVYHFQNSKKKNGRASFLAYSSHKFLRNRTKSWHFQQTQLWTQLPC